MAQPRGKPKNIRGGPQHGPPRMIVDRIDRQFGIT
jgi:hypothetical protein